MPKEHDCTTMPLRPQRICLLFVYLCLVFFFATHSATFVGEKLQTWFCLCSVQMLDHGALKRERDTLSSDDCTTRLDLMQHKQTGRNVLTVCLDRLVLFFLTPVGKMEVKEMERKLRTRTHTHMFMMDVELKHLFLFLVVSTFCCFCRFFFIFFWSKALHYDRGSCR